MRTETPVAISYVKRYYFAQGGRGCSLSFEAREDVFPRASRWADYIASTLRFGEAAGRREVNATLARLGDGLGRLLRGPDRLRGRGGARRARAGDFAVPSRGRRRVGDDARSRAAPACGRPSPRTTSTASLPEAFRRRAAAGLWVEVEYFGPHYGEFRLQYASTDRAAALGRPLQGRRAALAAGGGRACAASAGPSSPCPTSTPAARRTRAPPSASSSAASCSSPASR